MLRDFILIVLGIVITYLAPFIQDFSHALLSSPRNWSTAMKGLKKSWKGLAIVIAFAGLIAFGLGKYDDAQNKMLIEAENKRNTDLINLIDRSLNDRNNELIDRLDKLIGILEANNVSENTTASE
jgi:hypothetical protein